MKMVQSYGNGSKPLERGHTKEVTRYGGPQDFSRLIDTRVVSLHLAAVHTILQHEVE